jgi:hypothetical protein
MQRKSLHVNKISHIRHSADIRRTVYHSETGAFALDAHKLKEGA